MQPCFTDFGNVPPAIIIRMSPFSGIQTESLILIRLTLAEWFDQQ